MEQHRRKNQWAFWRRQASKRKPLVTSLRLLALEDRIVPAITAGGEFFVPQPDNQATTTVVANAGLLSNVAAAGPLSVAGYTAPAHGSLAVNADGSLQYTPDSTFTGLDSFTFTVSDGTDQLTETAVVSTDPNEGTYVAAANAASLAYQSDATAAKADRDTAVNATQSTALAAMQDAEAAFNAVTTPAYQTYSDAKQAAWDAYQSALDEAFSTAAAAESSALQQLQATAGSDWVVGQSQPQTPEQQAAVDTYNQQMSDAVQAWFTARSNAAQTRGAVIAQAEATYAGTVDTALDQLKQAAAASEATRQAIEAQAQSTYRDALNQAAARFTQAEGSAWTALQNAICTRTGTQNGQQESQLHAIADELGVSFTLRMTLPALSSDPPPNFSDKIDPNSKAVMFAMAPPESTSQTIEKLLATGDAQTITEFLRDVGTYLDPKVFAALKARAVMLTAIEAAQAAASVAAQQAGRAVYLRILDAFFLYRWVPTFNATVLATMRLGQQIAQNAIAFYQKQLLTLTDPQKIANAQKNIQTQQTRLNQIAEYLTANGQTP